MRTKLIGSIALLSILTFAACGGSSGSVGDQLSALTISSGTLSPAFVSGTADYTVSVDNSVTSVTVVPTAKDAGATIKVNDVAVTPGQASGAINLAVGDNTITIKVTTSDGKATTTYTVTVTRAATSVAGGIGDPCTCSGSGCTNALTGVTLPAGGTITGCSNIPQANISAGRALMCLRSFESTGTAQSLGVPSLYFANGYCALGAAKCTNTGALDLCSADPGSTFGNYDTMTTCPSGSVMISYSLSLPSLSIAIYTKACTKSCTVNTDCRNNETDPVFANATTGYECIDKNGVEFCFDPRDFTGAYTAQAF
jgi:Cadherin-like beta sandwich domain